MSTIPLAAVARRQHALFTRRQALAAGYSASTVARRLRTGKWLEPEPRVYRRADAGPPTWHQRLHALVLTTDGVASHLGAAALYGLAEPGALSVTVSRERRSARHRRPEVVSTIELSPADLAVVDGIPATTPCRTLIDLAAVMAHDDFEDLLDTALVRGIARREPLRRRAEALRAPRRRGCAVVLRLLDARHPDVERARNEWEARLLRLARRCRLPDPVPNHEVSVGGRRRVLDLAWPEEGVAVEFDGFVPHSTRRRFDDDRSRQNDLVDAGWRLYRFTSATVTEADFAPVVRAVSAAASRRRPRRSSGR